MGFRAGRSLLDGGFTAGLGGYDAPASDLVPGCAVRATICWPANLNIFTTGQLSPLFDSFSVHVEEGFPAPASDLRVGCVGVRLSVSADPRSARCLTVYYRCTAEMNPDKSFHHESACRVPIEINEATVFLSCRLLFKAHRLVYHSTLGLRVIKKRREGVRV